MPMPGKEGAVTTEELVISALPQADALSKLLIEERLVTKAEFMQKVSAERAIYRAMPGKLRSR